jgi:two-component system sensor histidine kinase KdpD
VVVGLVETHGRQKTVEQLRNLEVIPRVTRTYRDVQLDEMDLDAILQRRPEVVLVDELAHTNVPGGAHEKRWQDVEALLDAGINVITTVNIQHLESVSDVVEKITGIKQNETIPDAVVRRAEQIELVDITPEALRRRMAHGNIYAPDKIDASLSNYFRSGNLTALRELALLWLADRVEDSLQHYLSDHGISDAWETRERLIVALTGTGTDEALLRRAARIASRTGAELMAVHVVNTGGLLKEAADTAKARELVGELDGTFQEIVDEDVAGALVAFARSERGTQIVLGASRPRSSLSLTGGVVEKVLRLARDLDVHIIAVGGERPRPVRRRRRKSRFSWPRTLVALAIVALTMPLITFAMTEARSSLSLSTVFLVYLVEVLILSTWGGSVVGVVAALVASALENYYFVTPVHTFAVARPDDVVAIVAFLVFAVGASVLVGQFRQRSNEAERARTEAQVLARAAATVATTRDDLLPLLESLRAIFDLPGVVLLSRRDGLWVPDLQSGEPVDESEASSRFVIDDDHVIVLAGDALDTQDRLLVTAFANRFAAGLQEVGARRAADEQHAIDQAEALRTGLLRAISQDLRQPLSVIDAKVASMLSLDSADSHERQRETLVEVDQEIRRLIRQVANLVEAGRLEAGAVKPQSLSVSARELVANALATIDTLGRTLDVDLDDGLPMLRTDPELVEQVIATVVSNACRFSPVDRPVRICAGVVGLFLELLVIDRGPGIPEAQRRGILAPFERLEDEEEGAGLGLAVAARLVNLLGGQLRFEDTPGGGLTVAIEFLQDLHE